MEELYDVVHKVAELSITSDSETVRIRSRQVSRDSLFVGAGKWKGLECIYNSFVFSSGANLLMCVYVCVYVRIFVISLFVYFDYFLLHVRLYCSFCWTTLWVRS